MKKSEYSPVPNKESRHKIGSLNSSSKNNNRLQSVTSMSEDQLSQNSSALQYSLTQPTHDIMDDKNSITVSQRSATPVNYNLAARRETAKFMADVQPMMFHSQVPDSDKHQYTSELNNPDIVSKMH